MGHYAELFRGGVAEPIGLWPTPTVVAASAQPPSKARLDRLFPAAAKRWIVTATEPAEAAGMRVLDADGRERPVRDLAAAVRESRRPVVLLDGVKGTPARLLLALLRNGVWTTLEYRGGAWRRTWLGSAFGFRLIRLAYGGLRALVDWGLHRLTRAPDGTRPRPRVVMVLRLDRFLMPPLNSAGWDRLARAIRSRRAALPVGRPLRITLYVGSLNSGGAERQHGNLAVGLTQRKHHVRMLTANPLAGADAHYLELFTSRGIDVAQAGSQPRADVTSSELHEKLDPALVASLSPEIRDCVVDLAGELLAEPTDVLHCTLDYTNVVGAAAGLLVGVPAIVLSTRNVNPSTFSFYRPWMTPWYRFLATQPQVHFIANSRNGGADYARWMGAAESRMTVVLNGVDLDGTHEPPRAKVDAVRAELGAGGNTPVVAGIFRLSWEKQPFVFLDVVERLAREMPELKVALVGIGPLERAVRRAIGERSLTDTVILLGQRRDVPAILAAADVLLLTSAFEGTPNVVLEAQWLRRPVVATACGGTPDSLLDGTTGFVHGRLDVEGLASSIRRLLKEPDLRTAMGEKGRRYVRDAFSVDRMVEGTLAVYERALSREPEAVRHLRAGSAR